MNRPSTRSSAVLPELTGPPVTGSPWRWSAAEPEPSGRLSLPTAARRVLVGDVAGAHEVSGVVRGDTLVLRTQAGNGRAMTVDGRGRIYLPVWLRRHTGFLIGTHHDADDFAGMDEHHVARFVQWRSSHHLTSRDRCTDHVIASHRDLGLVMQHADQSALDPGALHGEPHVVVRTPLTVHTIEKTATHGQHVVHPEVGLANIHDNVCREPRFDRVAHQGRRRSQRATRL
ncbi:MAG: hypothetical protein U5K30_14385 [Acidimicrobiales bacterium]|nr:hypothetical protein [Acidimicrobiales bacterium]